MKFTITRTNKQNKLMVSTKTIDSFLERIAKDDSKQSVRPIRSVSFEDIALCSFLRRNSVFANKFNIFR